MNKLLLLSAVLCASTVSLAAQSQAAEDPAARQFNAWLAAFNSGDRATLLKYLEVNRPSSVARLDDELEFHRRTGGFTLKKIEASTAVSFTGLVQEKDSEQFARVVLEVEAAEPHKITKLELGAVERPAEFAIPRLGEAQAVAALRAYLEKETVAERFSGAALVAKNGKTVFSQAYGIANREQKVANRVDTQFSIGSMNKMFTAVAVLQLVQAGKIKLTEPFGTYLTDYANKDVSLKVTIHQLLTHTGGTGDIFGPNFDTHRSELRTLQDYLRLYEKRGTGFQPGTRWEYSNYGFVLLGAVIEKVSGQTYYDYVQQNVFKPAGMNATDSLPENVTAAERATGYLKEGDGPWKPNTDTLPYRGTSAGGGRSTAEDLLRFANALETHKLLDANYSELLITGKVDTPVGGKYAYGFEDDSAGEMKCFGHGGGAPGMNGDLKICRQSGYIIAVLANMDPPEARRASDYIVARLPVAAKR